MKRVLCVHGVGGKDATLNEWSIEWIKSFRNLAEPGTELKFCFLKLDDLFTESKERIGGIHYREAISKFIAGWISIPTEEKYPEAGFLDSIRWFAGMPAQFVTDCVLRKNLRRRLVKSIREFRPHIVYAHSLGTLMLYDQLSRGGKQEKKYDFVALTSGSQLGHPAMRNLFGPLQPMHVPCWINLHNEHDRVFASSPIPLEAGRFLQVETPFQYGMLHHEALKYLDHPNTVTQAWPCAIAEYAKMLPAAFTGR